MSDKIFQITGLSKVEHTPEGNFVTITASVKDGPDIMLDLPLEGLGEIIIRLTQFAREAEGLQRSLADGVEVTAQIIEAAEVAIKDDHEWVLLRLIQPNQSRYDFVITPEYASLLGEQLASVGRLYREDRKRDH